VKAVPICSPADPNAAGIHRMNAGEYHRGRRFARTPFGDVAFVERGSGPVAVFVHGYPLNGYQWRDIIERLSDVRRCIALDLMGAGYTRTALDQAVSYPAQARMIDAFLDALGIDQIDLVGNDSGSAVSQIFAAHYANRLRSLTLTNSVVYDHWPPPSLVWLVEAARAGTYKTRLKRMLANLDQFRANLGHVYEHPDRLPDEALRAYYEPFIASDVTERNLERFITSIDARHTVEIEGLLKELHVPTLIMWGTGDNIFPLTGLIGSRRRFLALARSSNSRVPSSGFRRNTLSSSARNCGHIGVGLRWTPTQDRHLRTVRGGEPAAALLSTGGSIRCRSSIIFP
jgi:pimeloyl-ACP methyl ester carboxylesterase